MKQVIEFLKALKQNNNREWFNQHKDWYNISNSQFKELVGRLILGLNKFDSSLGTPDPKDCIFRIYRDVRFSPNKEPYKTNFGAYMANGGRKSVYAAYYLHVEPDGSFLSGGLYMAQPPVMKRVREDMDLYADDFLAILNNKKFKETFSFFEDEKLKRVPAGFDANSPVAEYLKLKHVTPFRNLTNEELERPDLADFAAAQFEKMKPLIDFLNRSIKGAMEG